MRKIEIEIIKTSELSVDYIESVNDLKNQHWKHTKEEHMKWFRENIRSDDEHLMVWGDTTNLLAYLNLVHVYVEIDRRPYRMFGIGNVCVSKEKEHIGIGSILMSAANAYLKEMKSCGLLLCHDNTLRFYEYCGWKKIDAGSFIVEGNPCEHRLMIYDPGHAISENAEYFIADRNF